MDNGPAYLAPSATYLGSALWGIDNVSPMSQNGTNEMRCNMVVTIFVLVWVTASPWIISAVYVRKGGK